MVVYEKIYFEVYTMANTFDTKIILHNYILYKGPLSYIRIFPVYLRMALIFTDF